jgi:uncharacterized Rossmann fold enzyme
MNSKLIDQINFYDEFRDYYFQIINDLKFDYNKDCESRDLLSEILLKKGDEYNLGQILELFSSHVLDKMLVLIYGCGPSLEETVDWLLKEFGFGFFKKCLNFAADGASIFLREKNIPVDAIFTDLDGVTEDEFNYSIFNIVHAHGDNIDKLKHFKEDIISFENIIGTTQVEPVVNIINPGGFTDGDRVLYFLRSLLHPWHNIYFIGMDFSNVIGKYSKPDMIEHKEGTSLKQKKLSYAVELLEWLLDGIDNEIYFLNSKRISHKFNYLTFDEFREQLLY